MIGNISGRLLSKGGLVVLYRAIDAAYCRNEFSEEQEVHGAKS